MKLNEVVSTRLQQFLCYAAFLATSYYSYYLKCRHLVYMSWQRGSSLLAVPGLSIYTIERVE